MESVTTFSTKNFSSYKTKRKSTKTTDLNDILQEYCLKRNNFNPRKSSPNQFVKKLHLRMKHYYNNLYKVNSLNKK